MCRVLVWVKLSIRFRLGYWLLGMRFMGGERKRGGLCLVRLLGRLWLVGEYLTYCRGHEASLMIDSTLMGLIECINSQILRLRRRSRGAEFGPVSGDLCRSGDITDGRHDHNRHLGITLPWSPTCNLWGSAVHFSRTSQYRGKRIIRSTTSERTTRRGRSGLFPMATRPFSLSG